MTVCITMAFIVRSSSVVGWIPLLLFKMCYKLEFFYSFLSMAFIACMMMLVSFAADSTFYGRITLPQFNFLYFNIVENLSKEFGTEPWTFYMKELVQTTLKETYTRNMVLMGMSLYTVLQMKGELLSVNSRFPYLSVYVLTNFVCYSLLPHKELRFLSSVLPLISIFYAFFWIVMLRIEQGIVRRLQPTWKSTDFMIKVLF